MSQKLGLKDLTPEYIIGLYKKHNLIPSHAAIEGRCCCALGAIAAEFKDELELAPVTLQVNHCSFDKVLEAEVANSAFTFGCGFDRGFDGCDGCRDHPVWKAAFEIGKAVRKAVEAGELPKNT